MQNSMDNFSQFGYTFQIKLVYSLLTDGSFLDRVAESIDTKYFDNESFAWIIDTIKGYSKKYKAPPSLDALAVYVKELPNETLRNTVKSTLKDMFNDITGLEFIKDKTVEFCQDQALKNAIYESVTMLQSGNRLDVRKIIDDALKVGIDTNIGHEYTEMFMSRITGVTRNVVPTGWGVIDGIMDGGLGAGELGLIVAPSGVGKSWGLVAMAAHSVVSGLNAVYYTMELSEGYVGLRFDSNLVGIPSQNLKFHKDEVIRKLETVSGNLIIKYYPTKAATVQTLRAHLEKLKTIKGFYPDVVFVDYADLLNGVGKEKRFILENIYEELRGLAGEYKIPIWTASQSSRSSLEQNIIEADKIAESYAKVMIADFAISLSRKVSDKVSGIARWHVIKNRFGIDGVTFPSKFDASIGRIEIQEESSSGGKETIHKMENGNEVVRQLLKKKYSEIESSGFE